MPVSCHDQPRAFPSRRRRNGRSADRLPQRHARQRHGVRLPCRTCSSRWALRSTARSSGEPPDGPVENLFAIRHGPPGSRHFAFAGHLDVVPPGDGWQSGPFAPERKGDLLYGRGAVDMKGSIAAMVAAVRDIPADAGTVSFIITGDEEGPATYGTKVLMQSMRELGAIPDLCLVGEPTSVAPAGRHGQDRAARFGQHVARGAGRAGPRRLSAACRQSRAQADRAAGRTGCAGARRGDRLVPALQPRDHADRSGQPGGERHSGHGQGALVDPFQRLSHRRRAGRAGGRDGRCAMAGGSPRSIFRARRSSPSRAHSRNWCVRRSRRRPASRPSFRPAAAHRTRASSRTSARWSNSASGTRPCTRPTRRQTLHDLAALVRIYRRIAVAALAG